MPISLKHFCRLFFATLLVTGLGFAQTPSLVANVEVAALLPGAPAALPGSPAVLPDAPQAQPAGQQFGTSNQKVPDSRRITPRKYAQVIEPWQKAETFTPTEKVIFSLTEIARPISLLPAVYSASYEQIFQSDPKYGNDAGAYGEKIGAAMLRRATLRFFSDGVFAGAFHQDPRYYRVVTGGTIHRSLLSAKQAFVRRGDDGENELNYSGISGRAASAALVLAYYPSPSRTARVVGITFATSIASDVGGNLVLEFLPNIIRKFPIMEKLRLE